MIIRSASMNRLLFCILVIVILSFAITTSALAKDKSCKQTTQAALNACKFEVQDDFWIEKGKCYNLSDPADQKACAAEANGMKAEGIGECKDQRDARKEVCEALGEAPYDPQINPADFVDPSQIGDTVPPNPYFPLIPGNTSIYEGGGETITVTVTDDTKKILGVTCVVVTDIVKMGEEVIEDTVDWFAQDTSGNVWYFGEIAQNFEDGELNNLDGSWKAGENGAKPGIVMKAAPQVGDVYRQEFLLGDAEDIAEILSLTGSATVPAAACSGDCLVTKDTSPLEPDLVENKYYASGIGVILEVDVATGDRVELVEFIAPSE
jgi:hypothetical protein